METVYENHLKGQKSPYLLQHLHNPVDWYPWGEEAFRLAEEKQLPVFLSIGYSSCHWCHVMEKESFENEEIAALLNREYVSVKVDREERPDIDAVYMSACQTMTGSGGWPLTLLLTPEKEPFFAATYLPPKEDSGRAGLFEILSAAAARWKTSPNTLRNAGKKIREFLASPISEKDPVSDISPAKAEEILFQAARQFEKTFDPVYGGFGPPPKFPSPPGLLFLLRYGDLYRKGSCIEMAAHTLLSVAKGEIRDPIGGGFFRYATGRRWNAPHYEKMLCDNALLSLCYVEAFSLTGLSLFQQTAEETLQYLLREMRHPQGGFYCSQNADSDGEEGKYYLFSSEEVKAVVGKDAGEALCRAFSIGDSYTERESAHRPAPYHPGRFLPYAGEGKAEAPLSASFNPILEEPKKQLRLYRENRFPLFRDEKILLSWNALAILSLFRASRVFQRPSYGETANKTLDFLFSILKTSDGSFLSGWKEGAFQQEATLDGYAYLLLALLEAYRTDFEPHRLSQAEDVAEKLLSRFEDHEVGGFYLYSSQAESLILRPKDTYDGALPSGNAAAALGLTLLYEATGKRKWEEASRRSAAFLAKSCREHPAGHAFGLLTVLHQLLPPYTLTLCTAFPPDASFLNSLRGLSHEKVQCWVKTPQNYEALERIVPSTGSYALPSSGFTAHLCGAGRCLPPARSQEELWQLLKQEELLDPAFLPTE